jgi:hypothetical protein
MANKDKGAAVVAEPILEPETPAVVAKPILEPEALLTKRLWSSADILKLYEDLYPYRAIALRVRKQGIGKSNPLATALVTLATVYFDVVKRLKKISGLHFAAGMGATVGADTLGAYLDGESVAQIFKPSELAIRAD